jgi:hypothetical protein
MRGNMLLNSAWPFTRRAINVTKFITCKINL